MESEATSKMYQLSEQAVKDSERWFGDQNGTGELFSLPYLSLCIAGEAGELANVVKKVQRGSLSFADAAVRHDIVMELADIQTYLFIIYGLMHIDPEKLYETKRAFNEKRFMAARKEREARG